MRTRKSSHQKVQESSKEGSHAKKTLTPAEHKALVTIANEGQFLPYLVGDKSSPLCKLQHEGESIECVTYQKVWAMFKDPIDTSDENDLNKFNEKYIYLYSHMMVIMNGKDSQVIDGIKRPTPYGFEKQILFSQISTPCNQHREVCTIRQYKEEILLPLGIEFSVDPKIAAEMEGDMDDNCIVIDPTTTNDPKDVYYICSKCPDILQEIRWQLNRLLFKFPVEKHEPVKMLSEDGSSFADVELHIHNNRLYIDKEKIDVYVIPDENVINTKKPIVLWECKDGNCVRPSFTLAESGENVPAVGENVYSPEQCFVVPYIESTAQFKKGTETKQKNYYFCSDVDRYGKTLTPNRAKMTAKFLVSSFNSLYILGQQKLAKTRTLSENDITKTLGINVMSAVLSHFQTSFELDCLKLQKENADKEVLCKKQIGLASEKYLKQNLCEGEDACVQAIESFTKPLGIYCNDPDNPYLVEQPPTAGYKELVISVNTYRDLLIEVPEPGQDMKYTVTKFTPADDSLELDHINQMKDQALKMFVPEDPHSVEMKMFYLPFFAEVDPWLEFFNVINEAE